MSQHENASAAKYLSAALIKARGERSQAEFARFLGIKHQQTYQRYESGETVPPADVLHAIATKLNITSEEMLTGRPMLLIEKAALQQGLVMPMTPEQQAQFNRNVLEKIAVIEANISELKKIFEPKPVSLQFSKHTLTPETERALTAAPSARELSKEVGQKPAKH